MTPGRCVKGTQKCGRSPDLALPVVQNPSITAYAFLLALAKAADKSSIAQSIEKEGCLSWIVPGPESGNL